MSSLSLEEAKELEYFFGRINGPKSTYYHEALMVLDDGAEVSVY